MFFSALLCFFLLSSRTLSVSVPVSLSFFTYSISRSLFLSLFSSSTCWRWLMKQRRVIVRTLSLHYGIRSLPIRLLTLCRRRVRIWIWRSSGRRERWSSSCGIWVSSRKRWERRERLIVWGLQKRRGFGLNRNHRNRWERGQRESKAKTANRETEKWLLISRFFLILCCKQRKRERTKNFVKYLLYSPYSLSFSLTLSLWVPCVRVHREHIFFPPTGDSGSRHSGHRRQPEQQS